jgi:RimJ/RimL family protein N-acetyltransferase
MANIHLRPATNADLETLYRFEQDLIATERPFDPTLKPEPIHYYDLAAMIANPEVQLLVAELQDQPVAGAAVDRPETRLVASGYARIEPAKPYLRHPAHAYLGFMYVDPAHRGKGLNTRIIEELRKWAQSQNITELRLDVYHLNTRAIRAYEKAGFIPHHLHMRRPV